MANALVRLVSTSYGIIVDIYVENIVEEEAEILKKMIKDSEEKRGLEWDNEKKEWVSKTEKSKE